MNLPTASASVERGINTLVRLPVTRHTICRMVKDLRKQTILFAKSFLRRLHKYRVSFAQHSLRNFTCLLLKSSCILKEREIVEQV
ncbi:hypothetical protein SUGI_0578280 [Cryptomeria japonica]|nr:hypothetical protein SUGI_0578280 [Cryptomeria japonica]